MIFSRLQRFLYRNALKPILFRQDPEVIHERFISFGAWLGKYRLTRSCLSALFAYQDQMLSQEVLGITFSNPVGLAAGFDKNAQLTQVLPSVGFGFEVIGSITGETCKGNTERPRLWRLPKSQALVVFYGLMNDGCEAIVKRLRAARFQIPLGVSVAKTNDEKTIDTEVGIRDYLKALRTMNEVGDFFVVNISCPNTFGGEPFSDPERLELLLTVMDKENIQKPIFLKLPADISPHELDALIDVSNRHCVHGFVISNLTKKRDRVEIQQEEIAGITKGGISGAPTRSCANALISHAFQQVGHRYIIIGVGGIFSAEDAYEKICAGATLVELITGMIYEGPQLIGQINKGLVSLLKRDGYTNITQAIGSAHKQTYATQENKTF